MAAVALDSFKVQIGLDPYPLNPASYPRYYNLPSITPYIIVHASLKGDVLVAGPRRLPTVNPGFVKSYFLRPLLVVPTLSPLSAQSQTPHFSRNQEASLLWLIVVSSH
jgi:hypothetical protein